MQEQEQTATRSATDDDYLAIAEVARLYDVSIHTIRRRIIGGTIFPGAKKKPAPGTGAGEMWVIPRSEVASVTLRDISPKIHYTRTKSTLEPSGNDEPSAVPSTDLNMLEARVSVLEQQVIKLLSLGAKRR